VSNVAEKATVLTFVLPFKNVDSQGSVQLLTGDAISSNTPTNPNLIVPVTSSVKTGQTFDYTAPPVSVSVITFKAF
jgi:alpha-L-arabinofuranosidase